MKMKRVFTLICAVLLVSAAIFAQVPEGKTLVVKPVMTVRSETTTPNDWGGLAATAAEDPRYELSLVDGYENLYSCTISLKKYFKTNKWKGAYGETVDPDNLNEGWGVTHQFVVVYRDEYGDQENKNNPNAMGGAQSFAIEEDDTEVTFYATMTTATATTASQIRSYCDAQAPSFTISNNAAGNLVLPPAIGELSTSGAIYIDGSGKLEIQTAAHIFRPDGVNGNSKFAIYTRGRHLFAIDFTTISYSINKVPDALQNTKYQIGTQAAVAAPAEPTGIGVFTAGNPLLFTGSLDASSATTTPFNVTKVNAALYYEIIAEGETEGTEIKVPLTTVFQGDQVLATWKSEALNLSEGLPNGNYTLKFRYETNTLGDVFTDDNDGEGYTLTFGAYNDLGLATLEVSEGELTPAFDPEETEYTVDVEKEVTSIEITATAAEGLVVSGHTGEQDLEYGTNIFAVTVNPAGVEEAVVTYILIVNRAKNTDAGLSDLSVSEGELTPVFDTETLEYTVDVANEISSIEITATATDENATVAGAGTQSLAPGENRFEIVVTAHDGVTEQTYVLTVNRTQSSDATLSDLTLSAGELDPAFDPETFLYTATLPNAYTMINITAVPENEGATVAGDGIKMLEEGDNRFEIVVTAEDGVTQNTYQLTVTRQSVGETGIASIASGISISAENGTIIAVFAGKADVKLYSVTGQLIHQSFAVGNYSQTVDKGIYILSINGKNFKIRN